MTERPGVLVYDILIRRGAVVIAAESVDSDATIAIDKEHFPDNLFREYVAEFDADGSGDLTKEEREGVFSIILYDKAVRDMSGLEYFPNLESITISGALIKTLDVSNNTKLTDLSCSKNKLTELDLSSNTELTRLECIDNKLETLDVSSNTKLTVLDCRGNKLTSLNLSSNTALETLYCSCNKLEELDLKGNTKLTWLSCDENELTSLDLSSNTELTSLNCSYNALTALNVSSAIELMSLSCYANQLAELDVSENTKLSFLSCSSNKLKELDVSANAALTSLYCGSNALTSLDMSSNTKLTWLECSSNQLNKLDVGSNIELTDLSCENNRLEALDISSNAELSSLRCYGNRFFMIDTSKNELVRISGGYSDDVVTYSSEILAGVDKQSDGTYLLDLSANPLYDKDKIRISDADSDNVPRLTDKGVVWDAKPKANTYLYLDYDLSNDAYLDGMYSRGCFKITDSVVKPNSAYVDITEENFPDENFRKFITEAYDQDGDGKFQPGLIENLYIYEKDIADLKGIEYFTYLSELQCSYNKLTSLDLSKNIGLVSVYCYDNMLESLDVSKNVGLINLNCYNNKLTGLDLSKNINLDYLSAWGQSFDLDIEKDGDRYKSSTPIKGLDLSEVNENYSILSKASVDEDGYLIWSSNPMSGVYSRIESVRVPLNIGNENYSGSDSYLWINCAFTNTYEEFDMSEVTIDEEHFPDKAFRNYLKSRYGDVAKVREVIGLDLCDDGYKIKDLTGIENFTELDYIYFSNQTSLYKADLRKNKKLSSISIWNTPLTALYIDEGSSVNCGINSNITVTAAEEDGKYVIDMSEYGGLDAARIFNMDVSDATVDGDKIYWDSKDDIPVNISYCHATRADYDSSEEYADKDYLKVNISITNNAPPKPEGNILELTEANFKDAEFRRFLKDRYDSDNDNKINTADVEYMNVSKWETDQSGNAYGILSLDGISRLNCLTNLSVYDMSVSGKLDLSGNEVLTFVNSGSTSLTSLDVSNSPYLEVLYLSSASLSDIDVSRNKNLRVLNVGSNSLTEIDVSKNKKLTELVVSQNAISTLDLSENKNLTSLDCSYNPRLTSLDFKDLAKLKTLWANENSLKSIDLTGMKDLRELGISQRYDVDESDRIKQLDLTSNTKLERINTSGMSLDIDWSALSNLKAVSVYGEGNTETLNLTKCAGLEELYVSMPKLKELKVEGLKKLRYVDLGRAGQVKELDFTGCTALTNLNCSGQYRYDGDADSTGGTLEKLNVKDATALKTLYCDSNKLEELDVTSNLALQELYCQNNNLKTVDTTKNEALKWFECSDNPIESIDLSHNKAMLTDFTCNNGSLTSLDVSENTVLKNVSVENQNREIEAADFDSEEPVSGGAIGEEIEEPASGGAIGEEIEEPASGGAIGENTEESARNALAAAPTTEPAGTMSLKSVSSKAEDGAVYLNLAKSGKFDKSKVENLSSGELTDTGIKWEKASKVPKQVTYEYDLTNSYQMKGQKMMVTLNIGGKPTADEPTASKKPAADEPAASKKPAADEPTASKKPTDVPAAGTSKPTNTPEATNSPTNTPEASAGPVESGAPQISAGPTESGAPQASGAPTSGGPAASAAPGTGTAGDGTGAAAGEDSKTAVKKPSVSKVKGLKLKPMKKALLVSWKKLKNISGYQIQYSLKKSFAKAKTVKLSKSKTKYKIKKLKSRKKYYVRIRAYKTYKDAKGKTVKAYGKYVIANKKTM